MTDYLHRDPTRRDELLTIEQVADLIRMPVATSALLAGARQRAARVHHRAAAALLAPGRPGLARRAARVHRARCRLSSPQEQRWTARLAALRATASP